MMKCRARRLGRRALAVVVPLAFLASGCTATGMGWIPSALSPGDKATFGFSYDGTTMRFSGSYHDPQGMTAAGVADVAFKGTGKLNPCSTDPRCQQVGPPAKGGCLAGEPTYESQNPKIAGSGFVFMILCDADGNGEVTVEGGDSIFLHVDTGPYEGYTNSGNPHGNITVKS